jgi:ATP/maltotriose-dependent transcriptional regulator MalT
VREEWQEADKLLEISICKMEQSGNRLVPLWYGLPHGCVSLRLGNLDKAEQITVRILTIAQQSGSQHMEGLAQRVQAQILAARGASDEAERALDNAAAILEGSGSRLELGRTLYHWGE